LADALGALSRNSVPAVLSNSYCRTTLQLYAGLKHQKVPARRDSADGGARVLATLGAVLWCRAK